MKAFTELYTALDRTTATNRKIAAMAEYFSAAPKDDAAWAVYFLTGRRLKRLIKSSLVREWAIDAAGIPAWLFYESYDSVGDLAETIALVIPDVAGPASTEESLSQVVENRLQILRHVDEPRQKQIVVDTWQSFSATQRFVWNKLLTGGFRVGVSQRLVVRALSASSGVDGSVLAHRLMGEWEPNAAFFDRLISPDVGDTRVSAPYPFCLANPLTDGPPVEWETGDWHVEWKWDGIRAQIIRRAGKTYIWSRGEELITDRFPEVRDGAGMLPDGTVLDGELVGWKDDSVLPFGELQRRIGRKTVGKKLLTEVPVRLVAFDILEVDGEDIRSRPLGARRDLLEDVLSAKPAPANIFAALLLERDSWDAFAKLRAQSRARNTEGLMLKRRDATYEVGRKAGIWWKWKVDPITVDAVLIYAQRGHGKRAGLYTDYTFGVWDGDVLVPFAKAYSGLTDAEIRRVDRFVRQNTLERFGPVRRVEPVHVFELGFEAIRKSTRHKSGIAVRFPRMLRWREDKRPEDADTIGTLFAMLSGHGAGS